jgi:hypothetical protein
MSSRGSSRGRSSSKRHTPKYLPFVGLGVVALLAIGSVAVALGSRPESESAAAPAPVASTPTAEAPPRALFLGDSYTEPQSSLATVASSALGWQHINASEGGTGFLTDGPAEFPERQPLPGRVAAAVATAPDIVVVAAGLNDANPAYSETSITAAVTETLTGLREGLPEADIYVIGPFWPNGFPNDAVLQVRDVERDVAASLGLPFVDPIAEGWITGTKDGKAAGNAVQMISDDKTHPSVEGTQYLGEKVTAALTALGATS